MLSGEIAVQLRARGFDVLAAVEDVTLRSIADADLLAHASAGRRCVVTANIGDFAGIAAEWRATHRGHAGIIYIANRVFPQDRRFIGAVVSALKALLDARELPIETETFLRRSS